MSRTTDARRVIINADDYGMSPGISEGILRGHRHGIVTSTTVMINMPAAAEAVRRLREYPALGVGVHLNAAQGPPVSQAGGALAGDDGEMEWATPKLVRRCMLRPGLLRAIAEEFEAQLCLALDLGVRPTHLDSHRHLHAFTPVFRSVVRLAARYDIPFVRWPYERLRGTGWPEPAERGRRTRWLLNRFSRVNARLARRAHPTLGTWGIAHTGQIDAAWLIRAAVALPPGVTEVMTHPGLADDLGEHLTRLTMSRRRELDALCDPDVRRAFDLNHVERIHYGHLAR